MVAAILFLLEIALGVGLYMTLAETDAAHRRIEGVQRKIDAMSGRVDTLARESKISHERLVDDLWRRASDEVDREIERGRARARGL
jgi:hypothetical protein